MESPNAGNSQDRYKKRGSAGITGTTFQLQLITAILLNALKGLTNWKLSTENEEAGKFDDVVLECPGHTVLLQAKHKQTRAVSLEALLSSTSSDFSIPKYFMSYQEIKSKFPVSKVIICTNAPLRDNVIQQFVNREAVRSENLLYCENYECSFCSFNEHFVPLLRVSIENYVKYNAWPRNDTEIITDGDIEDFLRHLQFYDNYPTKLDKVIEQSLLNMKFSDNTFSKIFSQDIVKKMSNWFEQKRGVYITEDRARAMFCEVRSDKYCQVLNEYCVLFKSDDIDFYNRNIIHVVGQGHLLQTIKIFRALQLGKTLFMNPSEDADMKKQVIDAFRLPEYEYLIMSWPELTQEAAVRETSEQLRAILERCPYKRIILIGEHDDAFIRQIQPDCNRIATLDPRVTFDDLTEDTQDKLINKRTIVFQGDKVSLRELLDPSTVENYTEAINTEILEKLIGEEEIKVGSVIWPLGEDIESYYINRRFTRETDDEDDAGRMRTETFSEENIFTDTRDRFIILANEGGSGKSTVLSHLAIAIKKQYPLLWVIKVDLDARIDALKRLRRANENDRDIFELLDSENTTNLERRFRKFVFSVEGKVVLMFDGVDEVTDYMDVVRGLLVRCRRERNFAKIFVGTREHTVQELEDDLDVTSFALLPMVEQDYIDFFTKFWTFSCRLPERDRNKCRMYAETLVRTLRRWRNMKFCHGNRLNVVPRELVLLAKIFQRSRRYGASGEWEGCEEFVDSENPTPRIPRNINVITLYERLIDMEIAEEHFSGDEVAKQARIRKYKECLDYHKRH